MYCNTRPPYDNELYHHGVLGMHWGVRRYQPYRKGDKVKGGKEIGKATKVEQRSIADRVKKGIAAVNKIKKELHKGNLEKAQYKYEMSQLKDAKKEVKKARRRQAEERIRERIREHREEERENKRLEEERRDRNLERAKSIAESAAQIGALAYGAYQLKKNFDAQKLAAGIQNGTTPASSGPTVGSHGPQQTTSTNPLHISTSSTSTSHVGPTHTLPNPNAATNSNPLQIHTSGSHGPASATPTITTNHSTSSSSSPIHLSPSSTVNAANASAANSNGAASRGRQIVQNLVNSTRNSHQANRSLTSHDRDRQEALDNNYRRSADRNSQLVGLQSAIAQARANADDSFNGHRSSSSQSRLNQLDSLASRANNLMNQEVRLTSNADAVANQYRQRATRAGRKQQSMDDQLSAIARANGMSTNQLYNASKKDKLKAFAKFLGGSKTSDADLNDELLGRMRNLQSSGNGARQSDIDDIRRELDKLLNHSMKDQNELYHHGVLGMHWGIRRYQPYRKGERVKGGKYIGDSVKTKKLNDRDNAKIEKLMAKQRKHRTKSRDKKLDKLEYAVSTRNSFQKLIDSGLTKNEALRVFAKPDTEENSFRTRADNAKRRAQLLKDNGFSQDKNYPYFYDKKVNGTQMFIMRDIDDDNDVLNTATKMKMANNYEKNKNAIDRAILNTLKKSKDQERLKYVEYDLNNDKVTGCYITQHGYDITVPAKYGDITISMSPDGKIDPRWAYND